MGRRPLIATSLAAASSVLTLLIATETIPRHAAAEVVGFCVLALTCGCAVAFLVRLWRAGQMLTSVLTLAFVACVFALLAKMSLLRIDTLAAFNGTIAVLVLATIRGSAAYKWWLSRARRAASDGSGALVFEDGTLGRTPAPAPKGQVRAFLHRHGTENAGYRDDADPRRFRVELVERGDARVRSLRESAIRFGVATLICSLSFGAYVLTTESVHTVQSTSCCVSLR